MDGTAGEPETNCDSSEKHGHCAKCAQNLASAREKTLLARLAIDEKHKQKNQEILDRKHKGRKLSKKLSVQESSSLATKLALDHLRQKKVEVFDSHAVDFTQAKDLDDGDQAFLPRHLRKRQNSQGLSCKTTKSQSGAAIQREQTSEETDEQAEVKESENSLEALYNAKDSRKASLIYGTESLQLKSSQHDTLRSYFKYRKENMAKENRLRKVQSEAKIIESEDESYQSPSIIRRKIGYGVLPPLKPPDTKTDRHNKLSERTSDIDKGIIIKNRERHLKLPKITRRRSKGKEGSLGRDPRFQSLLSCLVPMSDKTGSPPLFPRKRHYTM